MNEMDLSLPSYRHVEDESIFFIRFLDGGRVHIRGGGEDAIVPDLDPADDERGFKQGVANLYSGKWVSLCGKKGIWHRTTAVGSFADDDICITCYRLFPEEKHLLFEHDRP